MSITVKRTIDCPECSYENTMNLWSTINAQVNPEARKMLLDGKINNFVCGGCGRKTRVENRLLYHDMNNEFCVWYFPYPMTLLDDLFLAEFEKNGAYNPENAGISREYGDYFNNIHYVFSMNEMVRYINFREKIAELASHKLKAS